MTIPETLSPDKRIPFSWSRSNVFGNVLALLTNGPGLRGLTFSSVVWCKSGAPSLCLAGAHAQRLTGEGRTDLTQSIHNSRQAFQLGVLG